VLLHRLDLGVGAVEVSPTPDPGRIAVVRGGVPDVTLLDVDDGRVVDTLPVGGDVDRVHFQRTSSYVLVSRRTATEIWDSATKRRVVGPVTVEKGADRVAAMAPEPGHHLAFDLVDGRWRLTTHAVGTSTPLTSLVLGRYTPGSLSDDGDVLALDDDGTAVDVLRLDPSSWRRDVCAAIPGADLTAEDRAAHPDVPRGPVCEVGAAAPAR
jgi:hypothetical protein